MQENHAEWLIGPSRRQRTQDTLLILVGVFFFLSALSVGWMLWVLLITIASGALWYSFRRTAPVLIGYGSEGWWIYHEGQRQPLRFRGGSIRRRELLVLVWGFWPWQVIRVRPDSFVNPERFRHLKYALYGEI